MPLPVVTLPQIRAAWWSPALGNYGQVVEDAEDVNQAIAIIVSTPKGSDPHRPEFASSLNDWIDHPTNSVTPHLIREIYEAVLIWEPRVTLTRVTIETPYLGEMQRLLARIEWRLKEGAIAGGLEVQL